jgi:hypothetical protein
VYPPLPPNRSLFFLVRWRVRERAMHTVNDRAPGDFAAALARLGLADPDGRVRGTAAGLVYSFDLLELVSELERLSQVEESPEARRGVLRALGLTRVGYFLEPKGSQAFRVEYVSPACGLCFATVSRCEVEERGVEAVVAGLRKPRGYRI